MNLPLATIAAALQISSQNPATATGYSIDTRTLRPGDLFFAIRGENNDGHSYVEQALAQGAVAAVVERGAGDNLLVVPDTLAALQRLAAFARERWGRTVAGITGSAGKTSTKEVVASLLETEFKVGRTIGNYNNHYGLPLSILRLPDDAGVAVLEMGMNHAGELRLLAGIAKHDIAVVTNAGYAHIEFFDSIDGIAAAKRELVEALGPEGTAILNADDPRVTRFGDVHPGRTLRFGLSPSADVRAEDVHLSSEGVTFRVGQTQFESKLVGQHGVRNILAGIAVAQTLGIAPDRLRERVASLTPGEMRGRRTVHNGIIIFNDSYNSNPDAVRSMLDVLRDTPARRRIAVLGEMLELGRWAEPLHRDIGRYVVECGISVLVGIRGAAQYMVDAAMAAGHEVDAAYFFSDPEEAGAALARIARPGDAILFKGSRGTHVERALEKFLG